jgi:hypothetical protein
MVQFLSIHEIEELIFERQAGVYYSSPKSVVHAAPRQAGFQALLRLRLI